MAKNKTTAKAKPVETDSKPSIKLATGYYKVELVSNYDVLGDKKYEICYVDKPAKKFGVYRMGVDSIDYNLDHYRFLETIDVE